MQPKIEDVVAKLRTLPPERIEEVADFVDFLEQRSQAEKAKKHKQLNFPVISVEQWPEGLSLRHEDMYGEDGR